jgi:hypothetical protein
MSKVRDEKVRVDKLTVANFPGLCLIPRAATIAIAHG